MKGNLVFNAMFDKFKFDGHFIVRNLDRPHFCLLEYRTLFFAISFKYLRKFLDFFFNTEYKIVASMPARFFVLCYSAVVFFFIYICVRSHGLHNALLSAFYSKKIDAMIYFYLCVFDSNYHEKQLPAIAACSGFCFSCIDRQFTSENFRLKKKTIIKKIKFIPVSALFPARLIPSTLSTNQQNWIHSPRGHYFATIPLTRGQNDPGLEIAWCFERIFEDSERFSFRYSESCRYRLKWY